MNRTEGAVASPPRSHDHVVAMLRALARLPKGAGLAWRVLVPMLSPLLREVVCRPCGFWMHLDLTQLLDFEYAMGIYDKREIEFLMESHEEGAAFVDIGANQGFYSLYYAHHRPGARILAFEPDPYSIEKIRKNVSLNGFGISVCPYAIADRDGTMPLQLVQNRNRGRTSLVISREYGRAGETLIDVPTRTLMHALEENGVRRISALKIDVEGYEYAALRAFFRDAPGEMLPTAVVVEALGDRIDIVGGSPIEVLVEHGYRIVDHGPFNFLFRRASR